MTKGKVAMPAIQRLATLGFSLLLLAVSQHAIAQQKMEFKFDLKDIFKTDGTGGKPAKKPVGKTPEPQEPGLRAADSQPVEREKSPPIQRQIENASANNSAPDVNQLNEKDQTGTEPVITHTRETTNPMLKNVAWEQHGSIGKLIATLPKEYLTGPAGVDWLYRDKFAERVKEQLEKNERVILFPEFNISNSCRSNGQCRANDFYRMMAVTKALKEFGGHFISREKEIGDRFDKEMSISAGVTNELGIGSLFSVSGTPEMAARWYERALKQKVCTDAGSAKPYPCDYLDNVAKARLAYLCISGQACTSDVSTNIELWPSKGISLLQPVVDQITAWYKSGANQDAKILDYVHHVAIFLPADIQLKIALVRAERIRKTFIEAGAIRPYPDWRKYAVMSYVKSDGVLCAPKETKIYALKELTPRNPLPMSRRKSWPNWLDLALNTGNSEAIRIKAEMNGDMWGRMENSQVQEWNEKLEQHLFSLMNSWRKTVRPGMKVRFMSVPTLDPREEGKVEVKSVSGGRVTSINYPVYECVKEEVVERVYQDGRRVFDHSTCLQGGIAGYENYSDSIGRTLPVGYDDHGRPVNSISGVNFSRGWKVKVINDQLIEVPNETNCTSLQKLQELWGFKHKQ